jgi:hypothetical protein
MELSKPKLTLDTFTLKSNYYVVDLGGKHHYFPVKVEDAGNDHVIKFLRRPPVLLPGIVCIGKKAYRVRLTDLIRGRILKSLIIESSTRGGTRASTQRSTSAADTSISPSTGGDNSQPRSGNESGLERYDVLAFAEAADAAWQEQATALLEALDKEEGIEWVEVPVQPEQGDAIGPVPDTDQDTQSGTDPVVHSRL